MSARYLAPYRARELFRFLTEHQSLGVTLVLLLIPGGATSAVLLVALGRGLRAAYLLS